MRDSGSSSAAPPARRGRACRAGEDAQVANAAVSDLSLLSAREVAYARPGFAGVFDVLDGTRRSSRAAAAPSP